LSRDQLPLRADLLVFSAFLLLTHLSLGNVFCLDFRMRVYHKHGCTTHVLRFDHRVSDDGRDLSVYSLRPRNVSVPSYRPSMLPQLSSPPCVFFLPGLLRTLCHIAPTGLAASYSVGTSCLQRPSIRAGSHARHPLLYASFDESWKACGRRPHLCTGFFARPGRCIRAASTSTKADV